MTGYRPFRKKQNYTLPVVIILLALTLSFYSLNHLALLRSALITVLYPFQWTTNLVWNGTTGLPSALVRLRGESVENADLKIRLAAAETQVNALAELKLENERLREELGLQTAGRYGHKLVAAEIIAKSGSPWITVLTIGRGAGAGVKIDMPVIAKAGLVGKVIEVAPLSAKVLLISDPLSSVAVVDQRSRDFGVLEGVSPDTLRLRYVPTSGDIQPGDQLVTSPISSIFPPGIPIGTVAGATKKEVDLFYEITVKPAVNLSRLEEVFLVF